MPAVDDSIPINLLSQFRMRLIFRVNSDRWSDLPSHRCDWDRGQPPNAILGRRKRSAGR